MAVVAPDPTRSVIKNCLVKMDARCITGATALGLVTPDLQLTPLGHKTVCNTTKHSSTKDELTALIQLKGKSDRFVDIASPYWSPIARDVFTAYPPAADLINILEKTGPITLPELAKLTVKHTPRFADSLFRHPDRRERFHSPDVYSGQTVYQLKSLLYHSGILTERGSDTSALTPDQDVWALEPDFANSIRGEL